MTTSFAFSWLVFWLSCSLSFVMVLSLKGDCSLHCSRASLSNAFSSLDLQQVLTAREFGILFAIALSSEELHEFFSLNRHLQESNSPSFVVEPQQPRIGGLLTIAYPTGISPQLAKFDLFQREVRVNERLEATATNFRWRLPPWLNSGRYLVRASAVGHADTWSAAFNLSNNLLVTHPLSGARWPAGSRQVVRWTYDGRLSAAFSLELLDDSDTTTVVETVASGIIAEVGFFRWLVPSSLLLNSGYRLRLSSSAVQKLSAPFSLVGDVRITAPLPHDSFSSGSRQTMTWQLLGRWPATTQAQVQLLRGAEAQLVSAAPLWERTLPASGGALSWDVLAVNATSADFWLRVTVTTPEDQASATVAVVGPLSFTPALSFFTPLSIGWRDGYNCVKLLDADRDGLVDVVWVADSGTGRLGFMRNVGSGTRPKFMEESADADALTSTNNPFFGLKTGTRPKLSFADLDGDGDQDMVVGVADGTLRYFKSTQSAPGVVSYMESTSANPFSGVDVGAEASPALVSIDGDDDVDCYIFNKRGDVAFYENTGTAFAARFVRATAPLGINEDIKLPPLTTWARASVTVVFSDLDGDGDFDLLFDYTYMINQGTAAVPTFAPRNGDQPELICSFGVRGMNFYVTDRADIDGDGVAELVATGFRGARFLRVASPMTNRCIYHRDARLASGVTYYDGLAPVAAAGIRGEDFLWADMDRDGLPDLLINRGSLQYYRNRGPQPHGLSPFDYGRPLTIIRSVSKNIVPFDLDCDGDVDFFNIYSQFFYLRNEGGPVSNLRWSRVNVPNFPPSGTPITSVQLLDWHGNGTLDAVVRLLYGGSLNLITNQAANCSELPDWGGNAQSGSETGTVFLGTTWHGQLPPVVVDADGDGDWDVVHPSKSLVNVGNPAHAEMRPRSGKDNILQLPGAADLLRAAIVDFDGDGDLDFSFSRLMSGMGGAIFNLHRGAGCVGCPVIERVTPAVAPTLGGVTISLYGQFFPSTASADNDTPSLSSSATVLLAGEPCSSPSVVSRSHITCVLPEGAGAHLPLQVLLHSSGGAQKTGPARRIFSYLPPSLSNISRVPTIGGRAHVFGHNFGPATSRAHTTLRIRCPFTANNVRTASGWLTCGSLVWHSHNQLSCVVPSGVGRNCAVELTVTGQTIRRAELFSYHQPVVTAVVPAIGISGQQVVEIRGRNFGVRGVLGLFVLIGSIPCITEAPFGHVDDNTIRCRVGVSPPGTASVTVVIADHPSDVAQAVRFTYQDPLPKIPGLLLSVPSLSLSEAVVGRLASYGVALATQPTATVTVSIGLSLCCVLTLTEQLSATTRLTFDPSRWRVPQKVKVTAQDDHSDQGSFISVAIVHNISSSDPFYKRLPALSLPVQIANDDRAGVKLVLVLASNGAGGDVKPLPLAFDTLHSSVLSLVATEGGSARYGLVLQSQPTADVCIHVQLPPVQPSLRRRISAPDLTLLTVNVTFTAQNWDQPKAVELLYADDAIMHPSSAVLLRHTVVSEDIKYRALNKGGDNNGSATVVRVEVRLLDNDVAAVAINPQALSVDEGTSASYAIVLHSQPLAAVIVSPLLSPVLGVPNDGGLYVSTHSVSFNTSNWFIPQTVTLTAVDDAIDEGKVMYIVHHGIRSDDKQYNRTSDARSTDVQVFVPENDAAGVTVAPGAITVREGDSASYTVALQSQPQAAVTVSSRVTVTTSAVAGDGGVQVISAPLTFDASSWSIPQTVSLRAVDDSIAERHRQYAVQHTVYSADHSYNSDADIPVTKVQVFVPENDAAGVTVAPQAVTIREGDSASYTVTLHSQPLAAVTVSSRVTVTTSAVAGDGGVQVISAPLIFDAKSWSVPQTVYLRAVDDSVVETQGSYRVHTLLSSADAQYTANLSAASTVQGVQVFVPANDQPGPVPPVQSASATVLSRRSARVSWLLHDGNTATFDRHYLVYWAPTNEGGGNRESSIVSRQLIANASGDASDATVSHPGFFGRTVQFSVVVLSLRTSAARESAAVPAGPPLLFAVPPAPPQLLSIVRLSTEKAAISWLPDANTTADYTGSALTAFWVAYAIAPSKRQQTPSPAHLPSLRFTVFQFGPQERSATLPALSAASYIFRAAAENIAGRGLYSPLSPPLLNVCERGWFLDGDNTTCRRCPTGADCSQRALSLSSLVALPGWWTAGRDALFYRCPVQAACIGGRLYTENSTTSTSGSVGPPHAFSRCDATRGYWDHPDNPLCGLCRPRRVPVGGGCASCLAQPYNLMLSLTAIFVAFLLLVLMYYSSQSSSSELAVIWRVFLSYASVASQVTNLKARAPKQLRTMFEFMKPLTQGTGVEFSPFHCAFRWRFTTTLWFVTALPLLLVVGLTVIVFYRSRNDTAEVPRPSISTSAGPTRFAPSPPSAPLSCGRRFLTALGHNLRCCAVYVLYLFYPSLVSAHLAIFRCSQAVRGANSYLLVDMRVRCYDTRHATAMVASAVMLVLLGLGAPLWIFRLLFRRSNRQQPFSVSFARRYQFLMQGYNLSRCPWWEAVILLRKFSLAVAIALVREEFDQAFLAASLIFVAVVVHVWNEPYAHRRLFRLELWSLVAAYVTMACTLLYSRHSGSVSGQLQPSYDSVMSTATFAVLVGVNVLVLLIFGGEALALAQEERQKQHDVAVIGRNRLQQQSNGGSGSGTRGVGSATLSEPGTASIVPVISASSMQGASTTQPMGIGRGVAGSPHGKRQGSDRSSSIVSIIRPPSASTTSTPAVAVTAVGSSAEVRAVRQSQRSSVDIGSRASPILISPVASCGGGGGSDGGGGGGGGSEIPSRRARRSTRRAHRQQQQAHRPRSTRVSHHHHHHNEPQQQQKTPHLGDDHRRRSSVAATVTAAPGPVAGVPPRAPYRRRSHHHHRHSQVGTTMQAAQHRK